MIQGVWVVGLGYVGLPLAYHFAKAGYTVVGYDISEKRVSDLSSGIDVTNEVGAWLADTTIFFTTSLLELQKVDVVIVTVPTPIDTHNNPDFSPLEKASQAVGSVLRKWQIVVYESTVYPGCTEDICLPILEKHSWLSCPVDFQVGYSPERINPGDAVHRLDTIVKVVAWIDSSTTNVLADLYGSVVTAWVHIASSIKVAEASKIIENTQRDVNIALMNELQELFDRCGISIWDVLEASRTKRNFLPFSPGLVGGHCIGVDPYWLAYKAQEVGLYPDMILAGRRRNDYQAIYVAGKLVKYLLSHSLLPRSSRLLILWLTFKPDVPDFRNSKVVDLVKELLSYWVDVYLHDPFAQSFLDVIVREYGLEKSHIVDEIYLSDYDVVVQTVAHNDYSLLDRTKSRHFLDIRSM